MANVSSGKLGKSSPEWRHIERITAIEAADKHFALSKLPGPDRGPPAIRGSWWGIGSDQKALKTHVEYLNRIKLDVESTAHRAFKRFNKDHAAVEKQRAVVIANIHHARELAARFPEIADIDPNTRADAERYRLTLPPLPAVKSARAFVADHFPSNQPVGRAINQMVRSKGAGRGIFTATAVVAMAIHAVRAKKSVLEGKRLIDEWHGVTSRFADDLRQGVEIVGRAHVELVAFSQHLEQANAEIEHITATLYALPAEATTLAGLDEASHADLQKLIWWSIAARELSARAV